MRPLKVTDFCVERGELLALLLGLLWSLVGGLHIVLLDDIEPLINKHEMD